VGRFDEIFLILSTHEDCVAHLRTSPANLLYGDNDIPPHSVMLFNPVFR